jgi:hypothetical protein
MTSRTTARLVRLGAALGAALIVVLPLHGAGADLQAASSGNFSGSSRGYLGCVTTAGASDTYCFEAHAIATGAQAGMVEVVGYARRAATGQKTTSATIAPPGALVATTDAAGQRALQLTASLPGMGEVNLIADSSWLPGLVRDDAGCALYPLIYQLSATAPVIFELDSSNGTVSGAAVSALGRCGAYFTGPTAGSWSMPTANA